MPPPMRGMSRWATTADSELASWTPDLVLSLGRENVDDAVERLGGVIGVERRDHEVTGFGQREGDGDRLGVAHLADQDDVGVLA